MKTFSKLATVLLLLVPLAVTSTAGSIRRLGGARWRLLHRLVYVSAIAGVVHYYWLVKSDIRGPLLYAAILGILFAYRIGSRLSGFKPRLRLPVTTAKI